MKSRAVVTLVPDESVFLPIWLRYYSQFFAPQDIYVLAIDSTDGSTNGSGFVRVPTSHDQIGWAWHRDQLQKWQHTLIQTYEVVLCADVDEIVAPDPLTGTLGEYIGGFQEDFVTCQGYEVLHMADVEAPLEPDRAILAQRRYWFANAAYSKPLLARVPMNWVVGLHARADGRSNPDDRLRLIHLHRVDYDLCLARHQQRVSRPWNPRHVAQGLGYQNRISDAHRFHSWFYEDSCWPGVEMQLELIPERWRRLV